MNTGEYVRPPLGLPPGSVRGLLSLLIVIQFWVLLMLPDDKVVPIPINLYLLLTLVGLFLVSHGKTIASASDPSPSPLYLPGGTLRVIIIGGTALVIGFLYTNHPERLEDRLHLAQGQLYMWPTLIGAYVGGFLLGYFFRVTPVHKHWFFQAFLAWMAMLAMGFLFIEIIIQAFIQPTLEQKIDLRVWEAVVTGVTACYFGTRS